LDYSSDNIQSVCKGALLFPFTFRKFFLLARPDIVLIHNPQNFIARSTHEFPMHFSTQNTSDFMKIHEGTEGYSRNPMAHASYFLPTPSQKWVNWCNVQEPLNTWKLER
jgi:hypothetical protein